MVGLSDLDVKHEKQFVAIKQPKETYEAWVDHNRTLALARMSTDPLWYVVNAKLGQMNES
jgi:hypothetical protein